MLPEAYRLTHIGKFSDVGMRQRRVFWSAIHGTPQFVPRSFTGKVSWSLASCCVCSVSTFVPNER